MLEIKNLTIKVNYKIIINKLNMIINNNDKVAIIGEEGNGKSTLLKVINNSCDYAEKEGTINLKNNKIGYLKQMLDEYETSKSVYNYLFVSDEYYYSKINLLYKYLNELAIDEIVLGKQSLKLLSGGEKIKLQLLKLLLEEPDILLLDEPTNDLDIETLVWLEKFINKEKRPIIYVSHDETLLSNTANAILHLELLRKKSEAKFTFIRNGYDDYINFRLNKISHQTQVAKKEQSQYKNKQATLNQVKNKVDHQLKKVSRSQPHAAKMLKRKMQSIKSQERRMNSEDIALEPDVEETINFFFTDISIPKTKKILSIFISEIGFEDKLLLKNVRLEIIGSKHVVIIGNNGTGKTTLLRKIYSEIKNRDDIKVGYMPQNYDEILKGFDNPIDFIYNGCDKNEISKIRSYMGNLNFTREEMVGTISKLSGGTKAKLILLKLMYEKANVLILDEPTRNVSPLSNPIIRKSLIKFNGTIISVSHDRKFINEVADEIYIIQNNRLEKKQ